nr:hypothetical protein CFP56_75603 [Quercus suber]
MEGASRKFSTNNAATDQRRSRRVRLTRERPVGAAGRWRRWKKCQRCQRLKRCSRLDIREGGPGRGCITFRHAWPEPLPDRIDAPLSGMVAR